MELEGLQEQRVTTREIRVRALGEQFAKVERELKNRDVAELSTSRLYGLADSLRWQILHETGRCNSHQTISFL
jgi:hypothetical protein